MTPAPMNKLLADLVKLMTLERLELNLFRGESRDIGSAQVFGGQVLGQALVAASATVDSRMVHSLHAYFLVRGDFDAPIVYEVDRARDGRHFSMRRVVAIQHGKPIFNLSASFQSAEAGERRGVERGFGRGWHSVGSRCLVNCQKEMVGDWTASGQATRELPR